MRHWARADVRTSTTHAGRALARLAPKLVDEIFEFITNIASQGVTILLVGQNVNYTLQISHYGYVMETGRITLEGPTEMLMNNEFVRRAYLGIAEETPSK